MVVGGGIGGIIMLILALIFGINPADLPGGGGSTTSGDDTSQVEPGGSQADFIKKSVKANQGVFDLLNGIIKDGKIKLTYVPGNHDMGFTPENVNLALPGVNQARDPKD